MRDAWLNLISHQLLWTTNVCQTLLPACSQLIVHFVRYAGLGITGGRALLVQGIYGAVGPIANLFFIIFILDRVGRKKVFCSCSSISIAKY